MLPQFGSEHRLTSKQASMLVLNVLPLLLILLQECLCTSKLVTILDNQDDTSGIKECQHRDLGMCFYQGSKVFCCSKLISITVSCQRVDVNLDALGEREVIFPQGKVMTLHQTLDTGFEYEVGVQLDIHDRKIFL